MTDFLSYTMEAKGNRNKITQVPKGERTANQGYCIQNITIL